MNMTLTAVLAIWTWGFSILQAHHTPQPANDLIYDIRIGSLTVSPERNLKAFVRSSESFQPNLFEDHYIVAVQFGRAPDEMTWTSLAPDVYPIKRIDARTHYVAIHRSVRRKTLTQHKIQSIIPLTPNHKVVPRLQAAFAERPILTVQVTVSSILPLSTIEERLATLDSKPSGILIKEGQRVFLLDATHDSLATLAREPWVTSLDLY